MHGIRGCHDVLVMHATVNRAYCEMKDEGADYLKRLAFFTLDETSAKKANEKNVFNINHTLEELIDCATPVTEEDRQKMRDGLMCYKTYLEVIEKTGVSDIQGEKVHYEFYREDVKPPLEDIAGGL